MVVQHKICVRYPIVVPNNWVRILLENRAVFAVERDGTGRKAIENAGGHLLFTARCIGVNFHRDKRTESRG